MKRWSLDLQHGLWLAPYLSLQRPGGLVDRRTPDSASVCSRKLRYRKSSGWAWPWWALGPGIETVWPWPHHTISVATWHWAPAFLRFQYTPASIRIPALNDRQGSNVIPKTHPFYYLIYVYMLFHWRHSTQMNGYRNCFFSNWKPK